VRSRAFAEARDAEDGEGGVGWRGKGNDLALTGLENLGHNFFVEKSQPIGAA